MTTCRSFDGVSTRARFAQATVDGATLRVVGDTIDRTFEAGEMRFALATDRGRSRIAFAEGGLCEFEDRSAAAALFDRLGYHASRADRLASNAWRAAGVAAAFVAIMVVLYVWGVPLAANAIVDRSPFAWDQALGDGVLETLDRQHFFKPTQLTEARQNRIVARFDALRTPYQRSRLPKQEILIEFRRLGAPNALALPGDIIVVTDEIVELAGDDDAALLTVLAHELGHAAHRDAMRQLVRSTALSLIAAWYVGDVSNAAAAFAGSVGSLSYSREAEHQADLYAVDAMKANRLSTKGAAALFRRLEAWRPPDAAGKPDTRPRTRIAVPEYLSTHPDTDARIALFEADGAIRE